MNKLSHNLKNLLRNAKISENELARRTGISQQVINRILSGENKNPKISTLNPLCSYFMVSISQLIGDEITAGETKLNPTHLGWQKIPVINWDLLGKLPFRDLILKIDDHILTDIKSSNAIFALRMHGNSMEPKFPEGTMLIFDHSKAPFSGDFALLCFPNKEIEVRQIFITNNKMYKKCLNPRNNDYNITILNNETTYLGVLIQSRTDFIIR